MSSVKLKKILAPRELIEASWGDFFQDQSIEIIDRELDDSNKNEAYQIIDVSLPDKLLLDHGDIHSLLKSYFEAGKDFDVMEVFGSKEKELFSIKINDYLNLGYFIDMIVVEAYKNQFACGPIRSFLNAFLTYTFQVLHTEQEFSPIEIVYGHTEAGFAIKASVSVKNFKFDKNLRRISNFVDITEFKKKSQFVVSALWFKEAELKDLHFYFYKEQFEHKDISSADKVIMPAFESETVNYDPQFDHGALADKVIKSDKANKDGLITIKGSPHEADSITRIKGSGDANDNGTLKVASTNPRPDIEQQMLRMKDLLFKMKEQLQTQKTHYEAALAKSSSSPVLQNMVSTLTEEKIRLQDENKSLNARLQLTNRKLSIMDNNLDRSQESVRPNPEQSRELESLKEQNAELEAKVAHQAAKLTSLLSAPAAPVPDTAAKDLEIAKLTEIKALYENKMKEQIVENKKLDGKVKILATQLDGALKKIAGPPVGMKTNENHAKQLEHASNRVAEVTKEYNDKKKEVIQVKQENEKLLGKIAELEKRITKMEKKAA